MGASNRHGGSKISRRLKVMFNGQPGRHSVFRNYFGVKKSTLDIAATGGAPQAGNTPAPAPSGDAPQK